MYCPHCGKPLPEEVNYCTACGEPVAFAKKHLAETEPDAPERTQSREAVSPPRQQKETCCPACGSRRLQTVKKRGAITVRRNGVEYTPALVMNPFWSCLDCGHTFQDPHQIAAALKKQIKIAAVALIVFGILAIIVLALVGYMLVDGMFWTNLFLPVLVEAAVLGLAVWVLGREKKKLEHELERRKGAEGSQNDDGMTKEGNE